MAVDGNGRKLAEKTVATTSDGHLELVRWARRGRERTFALEDCRHLTRRLEGDLVRAGEQVVDYVAKRMVAGDRKTEAIRVLKRRISDEVFRRLTVGEAARAVVVDAASAAA